MIASLAGREILDSRGRPTVEARCVLESGATGVASTPSGMSTGDAEAHELRDGDDQRYRGLGCRRAVAGLNGEIHRALRGRDFADQHAFDRALVELDGTPTKARLGANTTTAASVAFARAGAAERGVPLYQHLADERGEPVTGLPRPVINLFSGGRHAGGQVPIQDVLVLPVAARTVDECLAMMFAIYQAAVQRTAERYGARPLTADEGGLAPPFPDAESMLADAVASIEQAGLVAGADAVLAVDVAASHFHHADGYHLGGEPVDSEVMVERIAGWVDAYPIVSVEDGLAEDDWQHWPELVRRLPDHVSVLGDDLLCTNPSRIRRAVDTDAADALLLKVNQIGTLSEAIDAEGLARKAGWLLTVSARSGETEDNWLADVAVGLNADLIKVGSITQSERLAKYNRLLEIEAGTGLVLRSGRADA